MPEINKENMSCYRKWFYGKISKQHVEKILSSFPNSAGCLLVRESESQPGVLVICTREETGNISYAADYENKFTDEASMPSALNQISGHLLAENKKNTIPGQTLVSVVERVVDSNNPSIAAETSDRHVLINSGENDGDERFIITPKFDIIRTTQSNLKDYTSNENSNEVVLRNRIVEKRLSSTNSLVRHSRGSGDRQSRQSDADSADNALPTEFPFVVIATKPKKVNAYDKSGSLAFDIGHKITVERMEKNNLYYGTNEETKKKGNFSASFVRYN